MEKKRWLALLIGTRNPFLPAKQSEKIDKEIISHYYLFSKDISTNANEFYCMEVCNAFGINLVKMSIAKRRRHTGHSISIIYGYHGHIKLRYVTRYNLFERCHWRYVNYSY